MNEIKQCMRSLWLRCAIVLLAFHSHLAAQPAEDAHQSSDSRWQLLEEAFPSSSDLNEPGYILRIAENGRTVFEARSGAADIEQSQPITEQSVFHIASLSKQITAAALAHAIQDGLVSLEDPVASWIPEAQKFGLHLKVAHLVYMTSGLTEYTEMTRPDGKAWATFHYFTTDDAIEASMQSEALQFEPGTSWQYSNVNYMLLARIVEKAYNQRFSQVVRNQVFVPLGMSASLVNDDITTVIPSRASAYLPRSQDVLRELEVGAGVKAYDTGQLVMIRRNSPHYGGSGVMTNMSDWTKWQNEILTQSVFGETFWALMTKKEVFAHEKANDAFGLVHGFDGGEESLWYSGGDIDTSTFSIVFPESGLSIACFSNNPLDSCEAKVRKATRMLFPTAQ